MGRWSSGQKHLLSNTEAGKHGCFPLLTSLVYRGQTFPEELVLHKSLLASWLLLALPLVPDSGEAHLPSPCWVDEREGISQAALQLEFTKQRPLRGTTEGDALLSQCLTTAAINSVAGVCLGDSSGCPFSVGSRLRGNFLLPAES